MTSAFISLRDAALERRPAARRGEPGVLISEGARTALLKPSDGGKTVFISEGQQLNGWTLREITRDALHFESGGNAYDLKFPTPRWPRN